MTGTELAMWLGLLISCGMLFSIIISAYQDHKASKKWFEDWKNEHRKME